MCIRDRAVDAKSLDRNKLTQASFRLESVAISPVQKIKIRGLFTTVGITCPPNEELAKAPALIATLKNLAQSAGGPAPQPATPSGDAINALENQSGNGLLLELFTRCGELTTLVGAWKGIAEAIQRRLPAWTQLTMLILSLIHI